MPKSPIAKNSKVFLCMYPGCKPDRGTRFLLKDTNTKHYGTSLSNNLDKHIVRKHFSGNNNNEKYDEVSEAKAVYGDDVEKFIKKYRKEYLRSDLTELNMEEAKEENEEVTDQLEEWIANMIQSDSSNSSQTYSSSPSIEDDIYQHLAAKVAALNILPDRLEVDRDLNVNGDVTAKNFYQTSDERLKSNMKEFSSKESVEILKKMPSPVTYNFKNDPGKEHLGFSAQKLEAASPHLTKDIEGYKRVDTYAVTAVLAGTAKNHEERIEKLETSSPRSPTKRECTDTDPIVKTIYEVLNSGPATFHDMRSRHNKAYGTKETGKPFNQKLGAMNKQGLIKVVEQSEPPKWGWA